MSIRRERRKINSNKSEPQHIRFLHFKAWNEWRKRNTNSGFHKFLVLIGVKRASPTFIIAKSLYGIDFVSAFKAGLAEGRKAIEVAHEQEQS